MSSGLGNFYRSFNDESNWVERRYVTSKTVLSQLINVQTVKSLCVFVPRAHGPEEPHATGLRHGIRIT